MSNLSFDKLSYDDMAIQGTRQISELIFGCDFVKPPSPNYWPISDRQGLIFELKFPNSQLCKNLPTFLRHFFQMAGVCELSQAEHSAGAVPIWGMLVEHDLKDINFLVSAVLACEMASCHRTLNEAMTSWSYSKTNVSEAALKLLIPQYPYCDFDDRLDYLILPPTIKRRRSALR